MKVSLITISALCLMFFSSCYYDNFKELNPSADSSECDTLSVISFSTQIVPILNSNCTNTCHNGVGSGHDMTTWTNVNVDAVSGKLVSSIMWDGNAQQMPQGATTKISQCNIAKIKKWVADGATNN
jgi:hypothetical protein